MKKSLFITLFLFAFGSLAQEKKLKEFHFAITSVDSREGTKIQISTNYGGYVGMYEGMECSVWGLHYSDYPTHNQATLAVGEIISVTDTSAVAILIENDTSSVKLVYQGDLLAVNISGKDGHQGWLTDLVAYAIYFQDQNEEFHYTIQDVFYSDSPEMEEKVLNLMAIDVQTLGEALVGQIDDQDVVGGIYDGQTMLNGMQTAQERDILSFLRYVLTYPGKYLGKSWKVSETYATWMINESPIVQTDLLAFLEEMSTQEEFENFYARYGSLLDADMILGVGNRIETISLEDFDKGIELIDKLIRLSELSDDAIATGWAYFQKARVFGVREEYAEALVWYLKANEEFDSVADDDGRKYALNNIGSMNESLGNYQVAAEAYSEAVEVKRRVFFVTETSESNEDVALGLRRHGDVLVDLGQYNKAADLFEEAIEIYEYTGNSTEALKTLDDQSTSYAKQEAYEKAVEVQRSRIAKAKEIGNDAQVADATFDIGFIYNGHGDEYLRSIPFYQESYDLHMAIGDTTTAALSLSNIAQGYWSLKELDKSIEFHNKTIALAEQAGEKTRIANSWDKLADLYSENGNPKKSLEAYDRVIELYQELEDDRLAETLNEVGDVYKDAKDYIKAVSYFRRSSEMSRKAGDFVQSSDALYDIADAYFTDKKYDLSKHFYEESMRDAAKTDYASQEIYCLSNIGLIYGIKDQYERSDSTYSIALTKAEQLGDESIIAFNKYRLGGTAARQRDLDKAERLYRESLALYQKLENKEMQVSVLNVISGIHSNRGEFDEALQLLDQSIAIAEENNDRNNLAYCYVSKSDIYLRILGEFDKAWEMQEKSMSLFEEVDNSWGIADSYLGFGNIKNLQGDYGEAIAFYERSDSLYAILGNEYARANPANNIGTIYYWQADYERSLKYFLKAIEILDKLGIKDAGRSLYVSNVGVIWLEQKKYDDADKWLKEALRDAREIQDVNQISTNLTYLGKLKTETEEYDEGRKFLLEALALEEKVGLETHKVTANFALGKLEYLAKKNSPEKYIDTAIEISERIGSDKELWEAYYYKALIARDAGRLEESKELFINAIETLEKIQGKLVGGAEAKKLFTSGEKQIQVYASLVDVLIMKGEVDLGMQYLERSNIESLRSKFKSLDIAFKDEEANKKLEEERKLKMKLDNIEKALSDEKSGQSSEEKIKILESSKSVAEGEYLKFVNKTINTNPELSKHFSGGFHPRNLKTDKNRRLIPDELVVLSYLPANDKLYIFAATSDTVIAKVVDVSTEELNKSIKYLYNFAVHGLKGHQTDRLRVARGDDSSPVPADYNTSDSRYKQTSEQLFNWVISPVRDELDKKEKVVVIPTGMLHFLPFQMLGERLPSGKFDFLIEHYTLFYSHSLDMLYQQKDHIDEISILAMANADKTLPASEQEVNDLKSIYPNTDVFLHGEASEDKAKKHGGKHNILHFATHGNLDYFDYHKSYLTLAPNEVDGEDGKLTIEEVWEIEDIYEYQMVTLSACKTAVSEDFDSGWAVSPATSFIDAGAPTVVASLWAVNDASTATLMKYFYGNLKTMNKVDALRRAQIELAQHEEFSHPYYWAPFILIGDWR